MAKPILVSACLLGLRTRYDGKTKRSQNVIETAAAGALRPYFGIKLGHYGHRARRRRTAGFRRAQFLCSSPPVRLLADGFRISSVTDGPAAVQNRQAVKFGEPFDNPVRARCGAVAERDMHNLMQQRAGSVFADQRPVCMNK